MAYPLYDFNEIFRVYVKLDYAFKFLMLTVSLEACITYRGFYIGGCVSRKFSGPWQ